MPTNTLQKAVNYNPATVMLNQSSSGPSSKPYVVGPQSVRATGQGPFDAAYRQNLATYAGSNFAKPGGQLNINPTSANQAWGSPSGGGNAPNVGLPTTLLQQALGGQPAFGPAQVPSPSTTQAPTAPTPINNWLQQYLQQGSQFGVAL